MEDVHTKALLLCVCMLLSNPAFSDQTGIHEMLLGGRIMGLAESRQLTLKSEGQVLKARVSPNGRSVAYLARDRDATYDRSVSIVKASGGSSTVLVKERQRPDITEPWENWIPFENQMDFAWSPDSRSLAFPATYLDMPADVAYDLNPQPCILVYNASGSGRTMLTLPEHTRRAKSLCWSLDGSKLAAVLTINDSSGKEGERDDLVVFNVAANSMQTLASHTNLCTRPGARPELYKPILEIPWTSLTVKSWSSNGKLVRFTSEGLEDGKVVTSIMEAGLDGKEARMAEEHYPDGLSPDGMLVASDPWAKIRNRTNGETTKLFEEPINAEFLGWAPNSKILVYQRPPQELKDEKGKRSRALRSLWLAAVEDNPINHMCVALDSEPGNIPTWSRDCESMAYICDGCLYLAQFNSRELDICDKLAAGLPLTEDEEKELLLNDAKILGAGMARFLSDWDDKFPDAEDFIQQLLPYLQGLGESLFFRPGTQIMAFQYFPPNLPIQSPGDTIMGMFDVGYGWKVILYVDGHVEAVPK